MTRRSLLAFGLCSVGSAAGRRDGGCATIDFAHRRHFGRALGTEREEAEEGNVPPRSPANWSG